MNAVTLDRIQRLPAARWLVIAAHAVIIGVPPTLTSFGSAGLPGTGSPWLAYPIAGAILLIQLRHSLAFADGVRPRGAALSFVALTALVLLPLPAFAWPWQGELTCIVASGLMVLPRWLRPVAVIGPLLGLASAVVVTDRNQPVGLVIYSLLYYTLSQILLAVGLYASARLLRLLSELLETRAQMATVAVDRERFRISRDLHDLLGHSLSAIALKGDLAIRLLHRNPAQAATEIEGLTQLTREARQGMRAISRDEHVVSLRSEVDAAAALLTAAGIDAHVNLDVIGLPPRLEHMLAWAVREGIANSLRHSQARRCSIATFRRDGDVILEIVNDGVVTPPGDGTGLNGLAERARALSGSLSWRALDGEFQLQVRVPEPRA